MAIYLFCLHGCAWSFFCHELDSWCAQRVSTECLLASLLAYKLRVMQKKLRLVSLGSSGDGLIV